ncbi:phosphoethanolamine transferase [Solimonas soli]|uniref:phosphoethanolamine transferase n=1 Tax=Solimonas soli TaxID=413479 RepID=UPI0004856516|nr:phosphoethanolamine transferase [Solimonas soli]
MPEHTRLGTGLGVGLCLLLLGALLVPNAFLLGAESLSAGLPLSQRLLPPLIALLSELLLLAVLARPWLWLLVQLPFLLWLPGEFFYLHYYGLPTSAHVLAIIGETNRDEISGYIGRALWLWLAAALLWLLALLAALRFLRRALPPLRRGRPLFVAVLAVALLGLCLAWRPEAKAGARAPGLREVVVDSYPLGMPLRLYDLVRQRRELRRAAERLRRATADGTRQAPLPAQPETYVVVIGEASRADHWQLYGYPRETTPLLARRAQLLVFRDAVSVTPTTRTSLPVLLSGMNIDDLATWRYRPSWISAFKAAGFRVSWLSAQMPVPRDSPVGIYAQLADRLEFLNSEAGAVPGTTDAALLPAFARELRSPPGKRLVILHMIGSHAPYQRRYPPSFQHFRPAPRGDEELGIVEAGVDEQIGNAYDNSVRYSDAVLDALIARLQATPGVSALWYIADHGQTLPADGCGRSGNGFFSRYNFEVPLLFWYSERYAQAFAPRLQALRARQARPFSAAGFAALLRESFGFAPPAPADSTGDAPPRLLTIDGRRQVDFDRAFRTSACRAAP